MIAAHSNYGLTGILENTCKHAKDYLPFSYIRLQDVSLYKPKKGDRELTLVSECLKLAHTVLLLYHTVSFHCIEPPGYSKTGHSQGDRVLELAPSFLRNASETGQLFYGQKPKMV